MSRVCPGRFPDSAPSALLVARVRCGKFTRLLAGAKARYPYPLRRLRPGQTRFFVSREDLVLDLVDLRVDLGCRAPRPSVR